MLACGGDETEKSPVSISKEPSKPKVYDAPPAMIIDTKKDYSAVFGTDVGHDGWFAGGSGGAGTGGAAPGIANGGSGGKGGGGTSGRYYGTPGGTNGMANTGGGGGAASNDTNGHDGGSGVIILKYMAPGANMTLLSNAQTAQAAPTEGRLMIYEETSTGSTTLDTDLKGYVSRDGGTTYTQTPLTLDTTYETGKTLVSGSVDISGHPSGTNMKYKIDTLNQCASKVCRLHGASLLWA